MPDFGQCNSKVVNIGFSLKKKKKKPHRFVGRASKLGSGFVSCSEKHGNITT